MTPGANGTDNPGGTMEAACIDAIGSADAIRCRRLPIPEPGAGQVRMRVAATAVNHVDTFVRSGAYPTAMEFPFVIGRDAVGTVDAVGPRANNRASGADEFEVGDAVWCNSLGHDGRQGAAAEYAVADIERVYTLPNGVDPVAAAAVVHSGATAFLGLVTHGRLEKSGTVFIGGGAGQVGSAAIRIAVGRGATVVTSASPADLEYCRELGAAHVFDYHDADVGVRDFVPGGVDVFFDTSGTMPAQAAIDALVERGRVVMVAGLTTEHIFTAGALYTKSRSIAGFAISGARVEELQGAADAVNTLLASGHLAARSIRTLPLAAAADAHALMERGGTHGDKLVLVPGL